MNFFKINLEELIMYVLIRFTPIPYDVQKFFFFFDRRDASVNKTQIIHYKLICTTRTRLGGAFGPRNVSNINN